MVWKRTYQYYDKDKAYRVLKTLKRDGVQAKITKRKLSSHDKNRYNSSYIYSIYRWRLN